jgi:hypothetical protein
LGGTNMAKKKRAKKTLKSNKEISEKEFRIYIVKNVEGT